MAYAVADDVRVRLGRELDESEAMIVEVRLSDAERLIKRRIKDLDEQIVAGDIDVEDVKMVEAEMILRLIKNPDGFSQESDGNYSYAIYQRVASGKLEVLDEEWSILGLSSGAFTLMPDYDVPKLTTEPEGVWRPWVF